MADFLSNWIPHILALICIMLLCLPTFYMDKIAERFQTHRIFRCEQIESIAYVSVSEPNIAYVIPSEHVGILLSWYNHAVFIQKRTASQHLPRTSYLELVLHSGIRVIITASVDDIEIQRINPKSTVLYWAKQADLREFLLRLDSILQ